METLEIKSILSNKTLWSLLKLLISDHEFIQSRMKKVRNRFLILKKSRRSCLEIIN